MSPDTTFFLLSWMFRITIPTSHFSFILKFFLSPRFPLYLTHLFPFVETSLEELCALATSNFSPTFFFPSPCPQTVLLEVAGDAMLVDRSAQPSSHLTDWGQTTPF